jgi:hypothetical protein
MTPGQRWTLDKPTKPGWYWYREPRLGPEVVEVYQPNGPDTDYLEINDCPLSAFNGEWQGPLVPNEEA